jgi:hypothetical protein
MIELKLALSGAITQAFTQAFIHIGEDLLAYTRLGYD